MTPLYFSVHLKGDVINGVPFNHAGVVYYYRDITPENHTQHINEMVKWCKSSLSARLKIWLRGGADIEKAQFYYFFDNQEIMFFEYNI